MEKTKLPTADRFEIFEQLHLHQACIDNDASRESALKYVDLYWPEGSFHLHDLRTQTFTGPDELKNLYDYAHSVFPIHKMRHDVGTFVIEGAGNEVATVIWRWIVNWKEGNQGVLSTGTYRDRFQKRGGVWKCLERISDNDPNWPAALFQPWVDQAQTTFKSS